MNGEPTGPIGTMASGILDPLSPDKRRALLARMRRKRFARREVIFHEGDPGDTVHIIVKGHVSLRVATPQGDGAVLRVLGAGDLFGEFALIAPSPRSATVTALDPVETMCIGRDDFHVLRAEHPELDALLLDAAIREIRRLAAALLDALYLPAEARLLRRLLEVAQLYVDPRGGPTVVPLSQDDLAGLAGVARQSANRILADARNAGAINISRGRIEIVDREHLTRRAR